MPSRRRFMGQVLGGAAALASSGLLPSSRVLGANDRIRIGLIGAGGRGQEIFRTALKCPNVEAVGAADVYTLRLDQAKKIAPQLKIYQDFRRLLDDQSINAVLIATPQHQHALNFVPAIQAGKDVYQEKTMAFSPDHAKRMRRALEGSKQVVQVGIQSASGEVVERVRECLGSERMGTITAVHTHMYRNAPYGGWKRTIPGDCDVEHVDWKMFQGEAAPHDFDPNRVINWRFFWSYSGGNVFENMVHQVGFWYKLLDLKIPRSVSMHGGNYLSPQMEVPDTMNVSMDQPENILFTWNSGFGNAHYGDDDDLVLGNKGTIWRNDQSVHYLPEEGRRHGRQVTAAPAISSGGEAADIVGGGDETYAHMQNFFDCVRSRKQPNCPFDLGFRSAVACQMALVSYREGRRVEWDADREEVV